MNMEQCVPDLVCNASFESKVLSCQLIQTNQKNIYIYFFYRFCNEFFLVTENKTWNFPLRYNRKGNDLLICHVCACLWDYNMSLWCRLPAPQWIISI